jgi:4-hydroxybenzoate polyprenyltransferase
MIKNSYIHLKVYLLLIRFFNQTGTVLLFIPCLFGMIYIKSLTIADFTLFLLSAFFARSCGCILNDIADKKIDAQTPSTQKRVIAQGRVSIKKAIVFFTSLVVISLPLLIFYSKHIFLPLFITGLVVALYPYTKRFFAIPQVFLGIAYASGFLISIVHIVDMPIYSLQQNVFIFYFALVLWVIFYDTNYAKRDISYDKQNKVNSSAIFFAKYFWYILTALLLCNALIYTYFYSKLLLLFIPCVIFGMCLNAYFIKDLAISKINVILIIIALISNMMISHTLQTTNSYIFLAANLLLQIVSVLLKPMHGFKLNMLCVVPISLALWF